MDMINTFQCTFVRRALISTAVWIKSSIQSFMCLYWRPMTGIEKQRLTSFPSNPRVAPFVPSDVPLLLHCTAARFRF